MKDKITDDIRQIFHQTTDWAKLELEYLKLTAAEKTVVLMSTLILGGVCFLIAMIAVIMIAFALVDVFKMMMAAWLAYITVAAILLLIAVVIYLLRMSLIFNPVSKLLTRLLMDRKQ